MRFLFIDGACCTFFKWTIFPELSFSSTLPTPRTGATDLFPIKTEKVRSPMPRSTGLIAVAYGDVHLLVRLAIISVLAVAAILRKMAFFATHITCSDLIILLRFLLEVSGFLRLSTIVHLTLSLTLVGGLVHYDVCTCTLSGCSWSILCPCLLFHIESYNQILGGDILSFVFQGCGKIPPGSREFGNNARCHKPISAPSS